MEAGIQCPICFGTYKDDDQHYPIVLPCGHSFCFACSSKFKQKVGQCPLCKKNFEFSGGFVKSYALLDCINHYSEQKKPVFEDKEVNGLFNSMIASNLDQLQLMEKLSMKIGKLDGLEEKIDEMQRRQYSQDLQMDELKKKIVELEKCRSWDQAKLKTMDTEVKRLESTRKDLIASKDQCEKDIENLQTNVKETGLKLSKAEERCTVLERVVAKICRSQHKINEFVIAQQKHASSIAKTWDDIIGDIETSELDF